MFKFIVVAFLALGQCSPTERPAACTEVSPRTLATMTSPPTATVLMPIGSFEGFTRGVAPYLKAVGENTFTRSTTSINGTQTGSGVAQLSLANASTNYYYTGFYTVDAISAVVQTGFTCSIGNSTATSYGIFGSELSASPTVAPSATPLIGTLGVCRWEIVTTGPYTSSSTQFSVTRLFVPASFGTDGYFTPLATTTAH